MAANISPETPTEALGVLLLESGLVSPGQLKEAAARKSRQGGLLGKILVDLGYIRQDDLISFLVKQCKIPHINLMDYQVSPDLFTLVPKEICLRHGLLPIDRMGSILTVAMVDPLDAQALEEVRAACPSLRIKPILCTWQHYDNVIRKFFPEQAVTPGEAKEVSLADLGLSALGAPPRKKTAPETPLAPVENLPLPVYEEVPTGVVFGLPGAGAFERMIGEHVASSIRASIDRIAEELAQEFARLGEGAGAVYGRMEPPLRRAVEAAVEGMTESLVSKIQQALSDREACVGSMSAVQLGDLVRRSALRAISEAIDGVAGRNAPGRPDPGTGHP